LGTQFTGASTVEPEAESTLLGRRKVVEVWSYLLWLLPDDDDDEPELLEPK